MDLFTNIAGGEKLNLHFCMPLICLIMSLFLFLTCFPLFDTISLLVFFALWRVAFFFVNGTFLLDGFVAIFIFFWMEWCKKRGCASFFSLESQLWKKKEWYKHLAWKRRKGRVICTFFFPILLGFSNRVFFFDGCFSLEFNFAHSFFFRHCSPNSKICTKQVKTSFFKKKPSFERFK